MAAVGGGLAQARPRGRGIAATATLVHRTTQAETVARRQRFHDDYGIQCRRQRGGYRIPMS